MNDISQVAANLAWLDPAAEGLASAVHGAFQGARGALVKDGLNGVWLRHPLHPAITDIPIGRRGGAWAVHLRSAVLHDEDRRRLRGGETEKRVVNGSDNL